MVRYWIALLPLCLGGCGLPPIITAATSIVDGFLLVGTGKSSADHGLSAVTGEDCATWRLISGEAICAERRPPAEVETAAVPAVQVTAAPPAAGAPAPKSVPVEDAVERKPILAAVRHQGPRP